MTDREIYERMVETGSIDPTCPACRDYFGTIHKPRPDTMAPRHKAGAACESGSRSHCTCPRCWG